ncbi:MAG: hypothetical protein HZB43_04550 [candidate division Zixibacteria bacterium]|nr:hypothetical protein [candidate division Zixibacteria bacterium]
MSPGFLPHIVRTLLVLVGAAIPGLTIAGTPREVLQEYVAALKSENWVAAESLWTQPEVLRSRRLDIHFEGVTAKYDCSSPLVLFRTAIATGTAAVRITDTTVADGEPAAIAEVSSAGRTVRVRYEFIRDGQEWRLASPVHASTRVWSMRETRFARIHFRDSSLINDYAVGDLDRFVDSVLGVFAVPKDRVRELEKWKIDYYLGDSVDVKRMTGFTTEGMTYLPLDAVISRYLPHYHELVHVLVNFALRDVPLYTAPWLQEGLAVAMGGRWGKSPAVLTQMGSFLMGTGMASFDDVLTYQGFYNGSGTVDMSYALSGVLVQCLMAQHGEEQVLSLYRTVSGTDSVIQSSTIADTRQTIARTLGTTWDEITRECSEQMARNTSNGLDPADNLPGSIHPFFESRVLRFNARAWATDSAYVFRIEVDSTRVAGAFLFRDSLTGVMGPYRSRLFQRQIDKQQYSGEAVGVVFNKDEAGVYDYRTNVLVAKFASGFSPGLTISDTTGRVIQFRVSKKVVPLDSTRCTCIVVRAKA